MNRCIKCGLNYNIGFPGMIVKDGFICARCWEREKAAEKAAAPAIKYGKRSLSELKDEAVKGFCGVPDISRDITAHVTQIAQETNDRFIFETVSPFLSRQLGGISISKADLLHAMQARRKLAPYYEDGEYHCKACGHVVRHNADVTDKYCPNCGQYNGLSATVPYSAKECAMEKQAKQAANELWAALEYFKTGRE